MKKRKSPRRYNKAAYKSGHNKAAYRSGFEQRFKEDCQSMGWNFPYEQDKIKYTIPKSIHTYTPDFTVIKNKCYIETKGLWTAADRKKAVFLKEQHPDLSILYVLYRDQKLSKKSETTYLSWAAKAGIPACTFANTDVWTTFIRVNLYDQASKETTSSSANPIQILPANQSSTRNQAL